MVNTFLHRLWKVVDGGVSANSFRNTNVSTIEHVSKNPSDKIWEVEQKYLISFGARFLPKIAAEQFP